MIGAGASGTEIASALGRLGTEVLLLEALDQILPLEDAEIAKACAREIKKQNVRIETGAKVEERRGLGLVGVRHLQRRDRGVRLPGDRRRPRRPTWRASASRRPASSATSAG